ncbi:MAG: CoA transferase [Chloroflexi bacterium]|nr:CoA transferase [Chloroflexota bacterium]
MAGPLEGIRVVELSTGIAGPMAGMLLADYGADVIKVEPPGGDPGRALPGFAVWNRGKRSVVVDDPWPLVESADVCINSVPPPLRRERLGDGTLVYLHMPPYVPSGTPWAGGGESNELLCAIAGPSARQSSFDGGPIHLVFPFPLYLQAHWAAACAVAALVERERSGLGQVVTVAGIHGAMIGSTASFVVDPSQPPLPTNVGPGGRNPTYTTYRCSDGQWLFLAALTPKFQANAFKVLGLRVFEDERIGGQPLRMLMPENRAWIRELMTATFATRPRDEWLRLLEEGDCPAGPLSDRDDWLDHEQVRANGLRLEVEDPERGHVVMPGITIELAKTAGAVRGPAPRLGESTDVILTAAKGRAASDTGKIPRRFAPREDSRARGPLAGVKVLDLGTILAGPYAGSLLAELGADVVKVESPAGDAFRDTGFVYNRGMRGLAIDLSAPAGQAAFHELARHADVVIDNSRQGVLHRLKADYETLAAINPGIVSLSVAGFGERGPLAHKPAFDPVLQAMSGMMTAQGGDSDPALFTIPINDVAAAATSVLGVCLALYHRARTGEGQRAVTSLIGCSLMMQSGELVRFLGRPPAIRGGHDFLGPCEVDRFYQTTDGWVRVHADAVPKELLASLASLSRDDAVARLNELHIPAAPARQPPELAADPELHALEVFCEQHFADGRPYFAPNRFARFSRTEQKAHLTPPGIGEHSREVLAEAGVGDATIEDLSANKIVREGEPAVIRGLVNYR